MSTEPTEVDKHLAQQAKQYGMKMQQLKEDEGEVSSFIIVGCPCY